MGDMYGYGGCNINPSSSPTLPPSSSSYSPQDEFSLFLRQILLPPSSSTPPSSSLMPKSKSASNALCTSNATHENASLSYPSSLLQDVIFAVDSASSNPAFFSSYINGSSATNVSSSTVGVSEYETDEYDCESEGGTVEAMVEEVPTKSVRPRSSSKRSRAAEVHNLSEKRRRSRINEKMKALQNLIPNSNKTDKASMLDEAIEYLKQLQLKVQMLSMRNGLSLHPMCFPQGLQPLQLSQMRMECGEENRFNPLNLTATNLPRHHSSSLPDKHTVPSPSNIINSETSFGLDSPILGHLELTRSSEICREDVLQYQHLNANNSDTNPLGGSQGTLATVSLSFEMKDNWKHGLQEEISQKSF